MDPSLHPPKGTRVLLVGAGGLGAPAALTLLQHRVSTLGLLDEDQVEVSNLHRQILYRTEDAGRDKVAAAADAIHRLSPSTGVLAIRQRLTAENALSIVRRFQLVLDGTDNFPSKFLINDACVLAKVPLVHAAAVRWSGQLLPIAVGAPCYRCLFEEPPGAAAGFSCAEAGVAGPVVGLVGALQAEAGLALLRDRAAPPHATSTLLVVDGLTGRRREVRFRRNPRCRACGEAPMTALDPAAYELPPC